jgi:hypothetical protein
MNLVPGSGTAAPDQDAGKGRGLKLIRLVGLGLGVLLSVCCTAARPPTSGPADPTEPRPVVGLPPPSVTTAPAAPDASAAPASVVKVVAVGLALSYGCALVDTHKVFCWGRGGSDGEAAPAYVEGLPEVEGIGVGQLFGCARAVADGSLYCWGINHAAQLGMGTQDAPEQQTYHPAAQVLDAKGAPLVVRDFLVGGSHACGLTPASEVLCWGSSIMGEAGGHPGHDAKGNWLSVVHPKIVMRDGVRLFGGDMTSCAVNTKEELFCWGDQDGGYSAYGASVTPRRISAPGPVRRMTFGSGHSCLITDAPGVFCRGWNPGGQLGSAGTPQAPMDGKGARHSDFRAAFTRVPELAKKYVSLAASRNETCGVTETADLECLGTPDWPGAQTMTSATHQPMFENAAIVVADMGERCVLDREAVLRCVGERRVGRHVVADLTPRVIAPP